MSAFVYHTALKRGAELKGAEACQRAEARGSVVLVHDLLSGPLPSEFERCDVLYTDLPWRAGFKTFEARAGKAGRAYQDFMAAVSRVVQLRHKPIVLIGGKTEMRYLPACTVKPTVLNGDEAMAAIYGRLPRLDLTDSWSILNSLVRHYQCVGDFCCGYGRAGRVFLRAGKQFVMSDYNAQCVGFIATWLKEKP